MRRSAVIATAGYSNKWQTGTAPSRFSPIAGYLADHQGLMSVSPPTTGSWSSNLLGFGLGVRRQQGPLDQPLYRDTQKKTRMALGKEDVQLPPQTQIQDTAWYERQLY